MESLTTKKLPPKQVKDLSILLTDDQEVRALNKLFRKLDKTTDVLSFSMIEGVNEKEISSELGDIVISLDMVIKQAKRFKCSFEQELLRLLVHGCLHLFGYDHVKVSAMQVKQMKALEDRLLRRYSFF